VAAIGTRNRPGLTFVDVHSDLEARTGRSYSVTASPDGMEVGLLVGGDVRETGSRGGCGLAGAGEARRLHLGGAGEARGGGLPVGYPDLRAT